VAHPAKWGARALAAVVVTALAGCTLPWEQLSLPGPHDPAKGPASHDYLHRKSGVPLAASTNPEADEDRVYKGTGEHTGNLMPKPIAAASETTPRDGITLNLVEASIPEAAKTILGDLLRLNYQVSDKVKGTVTLQTSRPMAREALLDIFEAVLRSEGAAIVVEGGFHRVVPLAEAQASGAPLKAKGNAVRRIAGLATQVVPLQYVAAGEMERIIKSIAPQASVLRADTARNVLVLSGTRAELAGMLDAVATFDVDWMRGMSFALFPLDTTDPEAIAQELDVVFGNDRDGPGKGIVRFVPNKRLRSILVISSRPEYIEKAEKWLRRVDMAGRAGEKQVHVYHVQNRPALELAQLLQRVYASQEQSRGLTTGSIAGRTSSTTIQQGAQLPSDPSVQPRQAVAPFNPIPQAAVSAPVPVAPAIDPTRPPIAAAVPPDATAAAPFGDAAPRTAQPTAAQTGGAVDDRTSGISVVADEPNNALVVTATPAEYKRIRQILERIDAMPNQVLLEATIAEVTLNDQLRFGVRWFFSRGQSELRFTDSETGLITPAFPGFSWFLNSPNVQVVINALAAITDVNLVSSPTVMTLDNKKAILQVGDEVPIATQSAVSVLTPGAPIVNSIAFRNTGVILNITPRIADNGRVLLEIEQEVSDVVPTTTSTIASPTIQQRRVKTTVFVNDGESVVLAGLMKDRSTRTRNQVPLLGDIPFLGNAFKQKADTIERTELLIAITPRVVKNAHHIREVTAEFRDKINMTTRPQRRAPPGRHEQIDRLVR
jgi:general secretion pathway protein D